MKNECEEEFEKTELIEETYLMCDTCGDSVEFCECCGCVFTTYSIVFCDGNDYICEKCYQANY